MTAPRLLLAALSSVEPHAPSGGGLSTAAIVLAALAGALALACAAWALARALGWVPRWALELRHSLAEAGFRTSTTWREFADWVRLGR